MHKKGFTLIEILVVATIIVVLSLIGVASYISINKRSRDAKRKSDIEQVRSALEMYRTDKTYYPSVAGGGFVTLTALDPGDGTVLVPTYMPSIPKDPKGADYYYSALVPTGTPTQYYGYCICAELESEPGSSTCGAGVSLPAACNYGLKNP